MAEQTSEQKKFYFKFNEDKIDIAHGAVGYNQNWTWYYELNTDHESHQSDTNAKFCKIDPWTVDPEYMESVEKHCTNMKIDFKMKPLEFIDQVEITDLGYYRIKICTELKIGEEENSNCKNRRFILGAIGNYLIHKPTANFEISETNAVHFTNMGVLIQNEEETQIVSSVLYNIMISTDLFVSHFGTE